MQERTSTFYIANLGPELARFFVFKNKGDVVQAQNAKNRSLQIIEKVIASPDMTKNGVLEFLVMKDLVSNIGDLNASFEKSLPQYCMPFVSRFMHN
ncbi:hypothetical protein A3J61_01325 [Candidatus Nomurabacteria bacterium RIFCSPHIGHO2_02_FULL_38_15]|uniref:Uncharacterized protein n=1 Tax=Candidatus Nomurabacteria bacterium RIFCSPHIGHO2_02_FULL_38_15 TaxID=1801752 RepID=A0A1F6VSM8_9BACT|nr:MAG: hypothetical protein A3J61_01325 [Candidatus Nomurabacteria bacterium RIFCSPHIGHO2_02_FULL_38_15]